MEETKDKTKIGDKTNTKDGTRDEITVVTVRCIDKTSRCEDVDKIKCSVCGEMTWLSIHWRNRNIDRVICEHCFKGNEYIGEDYVACVTRRCLDEALEELKRSYKIEGTDEDIRRTILEYVGKEMRKKIIVTD